MDTQHHNLSSTIAFVLFDQYFGQDFKSFLGSYRSVSCSRDFEVKLSKLPYFLMAVLFFPHSIEKIVVSFDNLHHDQSNYGVRLHI